MATNVKKVNREMIVIDPVVPEAITAQFRGIPLIGYLGKDDGLPAAAPTGLQAEVQEILKHSSRLDSDDATRPGYPPEPHARTHVV
jgi:hypothetical protein